MAIHYRSATEQEIADSHRDYTIDFAAWYSGMDREKVEKAFDRYLREVKCVAIQCYKKSN